MLLWLVLGCKPETRDVQSQPPPGPQITVSNGGYEWVLGAVTVDGTNVLASNILVRPLVNKASR